MRCPYCGKEDDKVFDTRSARDGYAIRRRRECQGCGRRFTTYEQIEEIQPVVVKRDGRREPFDREKVLRGLHLACRKRPVSAETINGIAEDIEREVFGSMDREITSAQIGRMVMERLREIDAVAYVRFASVHREFTDADQFKKIAETLDRG
jgi:transcriptional repressor NrdR